jgi:glycosyltransferase involved in cell wall biosynthesis
MVEDFSETDLIEFYGAEFWLATWWLSRLPKRQRPLLVAHSDGLEPAYAERLRACGAEKLSRNPLRNAFTRARRLAFTRSDRFVTASEEDLRYALAHRFYTAECTATIPLGLKPEYLLEPPPSAAEGNREDRVAFLGLWSPGKGAPCIAKVAGEIMRERPLLHLSLLGVGLDEKEVREAFSPLVQSRIEVRSRLLPAEILAILLKTKVFFYPTEFEGFGLALAEAMACGCAAVTTRTGFGAALVDGMEALICPFGDMSAMRASVERLLDDDELRLQIATAGQKRARTLRWETSLAKLEEIYLRWLQETDPKYLSPSSTASVVKSCAR